MKNANLRLFLIVGGFLSLGATPVRTEDFRLVPSDADQEQALGLGFGATLAASDDWIVVGAPLDRWLFGAVYVFRREGDGWVEHTKLFSPPDQGEPELGSSVDTDGDRIVVGGNPGYEGGGRRGGVYVYWRDDRGTPSDLSDDEWQFEVRLAGEWVSEPQRLGEGLGTSVAIDGDRIIAGAQPGFSILSHAGHARVFRLERNVWVPEGVLVGSDSGVEDRFGWRVAISGHTVVVSATSDDELRRNGGAVFVFDNSVNKGWEQVQKLRPIDTEIPGSFGLAFDLDRNKIAIGSFSGLFYLFERRQKREWKQVEKISPGGGQIIAGFGSSLTCWRDVIVVGATNDDAGARDSGSAYIYRRCRNQWIEDQKLVPSNPSVGAQFGSSVAAARNFSVVGSLWLGAAYVYELDPGLCKPE